MNRRPVIIGSVAVSVALLLVCVGRELQHRFDWIVVGNEGSHWATYAGTMQAIADAQQGNYRFLRLNVFTTGNGKNEPTGERDGNVPVWSWPCYQSLGEISRASNQAFVDGYNARMKTALAASATRPAD